MRALDGSMTDLLERDAFAAKHSINDIYSCSWGPEDDGKTVDGPHTLAKVLTYFINVVCLSYLGICTTNMFLFIALYEVINLKLKQIFSFVSLNWQLFCAVKSPLQI